MRLAILTAISCWAVLGVARAEPLPGDFEVSAGGHLMLLPTESCEQQGDAIGCQGARLFAGFEAGARMQAEPWFALGVRAAGSIELDDTAVVSSDVSGFAVAERSLWFWQLALEARFDPALWPSGLWIGADLGIVIAVDSVHGQQAASQSAVAPLLAVVVGWDFAIDSGVFFGIDLRGLYLPLPDLPAPSDNFGTLELDPFPYIALGAHGGVRW